MFDEMFPELYMSILTHYTVLEVGKLIKLSKRDPVTRNLFQDIEETSI